MAFPLTLLIDGVLTGTIYALVALSFVVVYKASGVINFALGEWMLLGSRVLATAVHVLGLGLGGALGVGCAAMVVAAMVFNRVVLRPLGGSPPIAFIMVTLGLGSLIRGAVAIAFAGVPGRIALPLPAGPVMLGEIPLLPERLVAAAVASACIVALTLFFQATRTGLALRAIADDQTVAMAMGIDVHRHFALAWALVGVLSVLTGALWTLVAGTGFGVVLVGLRVFPIVILGGLDSVPGTILAAIVIGVLESLTAGYLDPYVGGGFSSVASYVVLLVTLFLRPHGLLGRAEVVRV